MITDKVLNRQIKRLFSLPFAPSDPEGAQVASQEFRRVLGRCLSDAHLTAVIDHVINTAMRFPPAAELIEAIGTIADPVTKAPLGCENCRGTGFRSFRHPSETGPYRYEADYADFCCCERGVWRRSEEGRQRDETAGRKHQRAS